MSERGFPSHLLVELSLLLFGGSSKVPWIFDISWVSRRMRITNISTSFPLQSRVTRFPSGERNYHIFYQLLLGADPQLLSKFQQRILKGAKNAPRRPLIPFGKTIKAQVPRPSSLLPSPCGQVTEAEVRHTWLFIVWALEPTELNHIPELQC